MSRGTISEKLGISRKTVSSWLKRWEETGSLKDKHRAGKPRKTTAAQDEIIEKAVRENPFCNAVAVKEQLGLNVSTVTVRRRLREAGMQHSIRLTKELNGMPVEDASFDSFTRQRQSRGEQILEMSAKGMNPSNIAKYLGVSRTTVYFWLKKNRKEFDDTKTLPSASRGTVHCWSEDTTNAR